MAFAIVNRYIAEFTVIEHFDNWLTAKRVAMKMECYNGHGEYFVVAADKVPSYARAAA